jgi:hypothetical protein
MNLDGIEPPSSERQEAMGHSRLESWKEIAAHLRTSVRTVQRWGKRRLPVHRHPHSKQDTIYAYRPEIDQWHVARSRATPKPFSSWQSRLDAVRADCAAVPVSPKRSGGGGAPNRGSPKELQQLSEVFAGCLERPADALHHRRTWHWQNRLAKRFRDWGQTTRALPHRTRAMLGTSGQREAYLPVMEIVANLTRGATSQPVLLLLKLVAPAGTLRWPRSGHLPTRRLRRSSIEPEPRLLKGMKREFAEFLAELATDAPLALIIDDLHWADPSTVSFWLISPKGRI